MRRCVLAQSSPPAAGRTPAVLLLLYVLVLAWAVLEWVL